MKFWKGKKSENKIGILLHPWQMDNLIQVFHLLIQNFLNYMYVYHINIY